MRLLVLVTDAYGGRGGIAKFNRDMLSALCANPAVTEVVAIPRVVIEAVTDVPDKLTFHREGARGKLAYLRSFIRAIREPALRDSAHNHNSRYDGVLCGHIHLVPLAYVAARMFRVPLVLVVHGIEAWQPTRHHLANHLVRRIDAFVAVSEFTKQRLMKWTGLRDDQGFVVPNCVELSEFGVGDRRPDLVERYGLEGKTVILTLGRLAGAERYKGFDEVMEVLPDLARELPSICYIIAGDGPDRRRLEQKAAKLGISDRVVFAGYVDETEKADHYRLADAFVMPSRGEGFGIVYLEALACGVPVVASTADASSEAVRDGLLGQVVDPGCPQEIREAIVLALRSGRCVPEGLDHFSIDRFRQRWYRTLDATLHMSNSLVQAHRSI